MSPAVNDEPQRHQFSYFLRAAAAYGVLVRLPEDQQAQVLSSLEAGATICFPTVKKGRKLSERSSVLGDVHAALCSLDADYAAVWDVSESTRLSARKTIKFWFVRVFSTERRSVHDCARVSTQEIGEDLTEQQWVELCNILLQETYQDRDNNMRRFPSFEDYRDWLNDEIRRTGSALHRQQLASLDAAYKDSKARSWDALLGSVAARFGLVSVKERFRTERNFYAAQTTCKRLIGETPMLDMYRTKVRTKQSLYRRHVLKRKAAAMQEEVEGQQPTVTDQYFQREWFQVGPLFAMLQRNACCCPCFVDSCHAPS